MIKVRVKDAEGIRGLARDNMLLRCSDCLHYSGTRNPQFKAPCKELEIKATAIAPACFTPNIGVFSRHSPQMVKQLALMVRTFTGPENRVLASVLARSASLANTQHEFFAQRYYATNDGSYLSDWFYGYVLAKSGKDGYLLAGDNVLVGRAGTIATVLAESLITPRAFKKIKEKLIEDGMQFRPGIPPPKKIKGAEYEPPSIDQVVHADEEAPARKKIRLQEKVG